MIDNDTEREVCLEHSAHLSSALGKQCDEWEAVSLDQQRDNNPINIRVRPELTTDPGTEMRVIPDTLEYGVVVDIITTTTTGLGNNDTPGQLMLLLLLL